MNLLMLGGWPGVEAGELSGVGNHFSAPRIRNYIVVIILKREDVDKEFRVK